MKRMDIMGDRGGRKKIRGMRQYLQGLTGINR